MAIRGKTMYYTYFSRTVVSVLKEKSVYQNWNLVDSGLSATQFFRQHSCIGRPNLRKFGWRIFDNKSDTTYSFGFGRELKYIERELQKSLDFAPIVEQFSNHSIFCQKLRGIFSAVNECVGSVFFFNVTRYKFLLKSESIPSEKSVLQKHSHCTSQLFSSYWIIPFRNLSKTSISECFHYGIMTYLFVTN